MRRAPLLLAALSAAFLTAATTPGPRRAPSRAPAPPIDFSGVWAIDEKTSLNIPPPMKGAVLTVTQKGNRIWISPQTGKKGTMIMSEEIVADGQPYEKLLGSAGKGIVTARWAEDGGSLRIEIQVNPESENQVKSIQRSVWKLSQDRQVWVRETFTESQGRPHGARLVFRRQAPDAARTPTRPPRPPSRTPRPAPTP